MKYEVGDEVRSPSGNIYRIEEVYEDSDKYEMINIKNGNTVIKNRFEVENTGIPIYSKSGRIPPPSMQQIQSQGRSQRVPQPMQAHPYGGITPRPMIWKFSLMDIVNVAGYDYKVVGMRKSPIDPDQYECISMDDGSRHMMNRIDLEQYELNKIHQRQSFPRDPAVSVNWEKASFTSDGQEWTMDKDVAYESRCRHTQTKLNHAGGIVFKQCCHCKEDLGDA